MSFVFLSQPQVSFSVLFFRSLPIAVRFHISYIRLPVVTSCVYVNFCVICLFLLLFCAPPPLFLTDFITIPLFLVLFSKLSTAHQQLSHSGLGSISLFMWKVRVIPAGYSVIMHTFLCLWLYIWCLKHSKPLNTVQFLNSEERSILIWLMFGIIQNIWSKCSNLLTISFLRNHCVFAQNRVKKQNKTSSLATSQTSVPANRQKRQCWIIFYNT